MPDAHKAQIRQRNMNHARLRIILGEDKACLSILNDKTETVFNGQLAEAEGQRVHLGFHRVAMELDQAVIIDARRAVTHEMNHAPQLTLVLP